MVQVLTVILSQNWCLSQHRSLQPLSVFIAMNLPWSIKLFFWISALPGCHPLRRTPFYNFLRRCGSLIVHTWPCTEYVHVAQQVLCIQYYHTSHYEDCVHNWSACKVCCICCSRVSNLWSICKLFITGRPVFKTGLVHTNSKSGYK